MFITQIKANPIRFYVLALVALSAALVISLSVLPGHARAAQATAGDTVTIPLGRSGKGLRVKGARIKAIRPAKIRRSTVVLPVSSVSVPLLNQATLVLRGGFTVKVGRRKVSVRGFLLTIRRGKATITAKVGSRRITLFSGRSSGSLIDAATTSVTVRSKKLGLTKAAAKQLNKSLRRRSFKRRVVGKLSGSSKAYFAPSTTPPPSGTPSSDFSWTEPTSLAKPLTAENVASAEPLIVWPRVSLINYVRSGGGNASAELPATAGSSINPEDHICVAPGDNAPGAAGIFSFSMPFIDGWWDAPSKTGVLRFSGLVRFTYPDHGINMGFASAEVEFNQASSRVIYTVTDPYNPLGKRGDVVALPELASIDPVTNGSITQYAATITTVGNQALGGLYAAGGPFGCIQVGFNP